VEDVEQLGFDLLFHDLLEGIHQLLRRVEEILRVIPAHNKIAIEFCKCYWNTEFFVRYLLFLSLHARPFSIPNSIWLIRTADLYPALKFNADIQFQEPRR
jgi:hypothetical protein